MAIRRTLLKSATALIALTVTSPAIAHSNEPIPVVATFSILGEMVERIGGDHIEVTTLVGPNGDTCLPAQSERRPGGQWRRHTGAQRSEFRRMD